MIAESLARVLEAAPAARLAVLIGSAASGKLRPGSDIDAGVITVLVQRQPDDWASFRAMRRLV